MTTSSRKRTLKEVSNLKNRNFFQIKNATDTSADVFIYGDIISNTDWKWDENDVMPNDIKNLLDEHKGKNINLYVNSGGGSVFAGLGIYNLLKRHDGHITAHVDGLAGSIASVIIFAADKIIAPSNSFIMIHNAWTYAMGNAKELMKQAQDLERIDEGILNTYKENLKGGVDIQTIKDMMDAETWMTGEEAAQYFNIETTAPVQAVACASDYFNNYKSTPKELIQNEIEEKKEKLSLTVKIDASDLIKSIDELKEEIKNEKEEIEVIENLLFEIDLI